MTISAYDLGIHARDLEPHLRQAGMVKIIGYERGGKTTLSEILTDELAPLYQNILLQNASAWLHARLATGSAPGTGEPSIDPELTEAVVRLEKHGRSCWIIDDADVMLAYASPGLLQSISRRVAEGAFALVLIRNRFIQEATGWFHSREALLSPSMPRLFLTPLAGDAAAAAAWSYGHVTATAQVEWLVQTSGGIPGLMSDLAPFAEAAVTDGATEDVRRLAREHRTRLRVTDPPRQAVIRALRQTALPPPAMLAPQARADLAVLMVAGMVPGDYAFRPQPLCGTFWDLVVDEAVRPAPLKIRLMDRALRLELSLRDLGLADELAAALDVSPAKEADLAHAFALCLQCEQATPELAQPLKHILGETLGVLRLAELLRRRGVPLAPQASPADLAGLLLEAEDSP
jgi:hypothetical protein